MVSGGILISSLRAFRRAEDQATAGQGPKGSRAQGPNGARNEAQGAPDRAQDRPKVAPGWPLGPNAGDEGREGTPREHIRSLSRSVLLPRVANVTQTRGHGMPQEPQIEPQRSPRASPTSTTSRPWGPLGPNGDDDGRQGTPRRPQIAIPSTCVARTSSERCKIHHFAQNPHP